MAMIGQNPKNLNLAFNPVLNVRAPPSCTRETAGVSVLRFGDLTDRTVAHDEATKLA